MSVSFVASVGGPFRFMDIFHTWPSNFISALYLGLIWYEYLFFGGSLSASLNIVVFVIWLAGNNYAVFWRIAIYDNVPRSS